jgi:hypothetical protein
MSDEYEPNAQAERLRRLWHTVGSPAETRHCDPGDLGQYAAVVRRAGQWTADREFPSVGEHLFKPCARCRADLDAILELLAHE